MNKIFEEQPYILYLFINNTHTINYCINLLLINKLFYDNIIHNYKYIRYTYEPLHNHEFKNIITEWCKNPEYICSKFGHISRWNTINITNMNSLFKYAIEFNEDISYWNTSNVIDMNNMFNNASNFNINISK